MKKVFSLILLLHFSIFSFGQDCYGLSRKKATRMAKVTFKSWFDENKLLYEYKKIDSFENVVMCIETDCYCPVDIQPIDFNKLPKYRRDSISLLMCRDCYSMEVFVINEDNRQIGLSLSFDIFLNLICVFEKRVGNSTGKILYQFE